MYKILGCENVGKTSFKKRLTNLSSNESEKSLQEISNSKKEENMVKFFIFFFFILKI